MLTRHCRSFHRGLAALSLLAALALAGQAGAQSAPDSVAAPVTPPVTAPALTPTTALAGLQTDSPTSLLRGGPLGELMSVYPPRAIDEVQKQLEYSRNLAKAAEADIAESRRLAQAAEGRVKIMSEELETTKTRLGVAKKLKNEADQASLEPDVKRQEAEKKYLERLRDALRADAASLDGQMDAAAARVKALDLELDVARRHTQLSTTVAPTPDDIADYRARLRKMLDAQSDASKRVKAAADKSQEVADRRLKQLDALSKLTTP